MNAKLFDILEKTDGMNMPLYPDRGGSSNLRNPERSKAAEFPTDFEKRPQRRQPRAEEHK
jgi:N-acetylglucosamine-6-sulfatase